MSKIICLDYETYFDDECSVKTLGNWAYTRHPKFDAYMLSAYDGEQSWVGHPRDFNWSALEGATLVAHNAGFDKSVTDSLTEKNLAPAIPNPWVCTANMAAYLVYERSLAAALWQLEGIRVTKTLRDDMKGKVFSELSAEEQLAFANYAKADAIHCWNLYAKHSHKWPQFERDLSDLTIKQSLRGGAINVELLEKYRGVLKLAIWKLAKTLPWMENEDAKPTSTKAIAAECRKVGIPCPPVKSHDGGEEAFAEWEATYAPKFAFVAGVGRYRSLNKLAGTLDTINDRLRPDGTIDFSLLYFGAHTGRWSGGGAGLNMQNLRKEPLYFKDGVEVQTEDESDTAVDVRALFIPRTGKKFIICDLSQIEPRVMAWLIGDQQFLDFVAAGQSPYEAHARATMKWTGGSLKKENADLYKLAKARVLGLGYGCGDEKFIDVARDMAGLVVTPEESTETVRSFREQNPLITGLWDTLDADFKNSRNSDFEVELPSGRCLTYRKVQRESRLKLNKKTGEKVSRFVHTALIGKTGRLMRQETYGGKLTENLVQAASRDVFGLHLLGLEENFGDVIFHVHDEAIVEVDADVTVAEIEKAMSVAPDWLAGCPLAAEGKEAALYLK